MTVTPILTMSCDTSVLVHIEVWVDTETSLFGFDVSNVQLRQGQPTLVPVRGAVPATQSAGSFKVKVEVYDVTRRHREGWDEDAASLVVS